ncbi:hypothetical protein, partial [Streptomyces nanshensis]|uniref:hypothetical protein n=1 Tax=Streptomyces nanshensis TaxID=518642 RepID=UPI001FD5CC7D
MRRRTGTGTGHSGTCRGGGHGLQRHDAGDDTGALDQMVAYEGVGGGEAQREVPAPPVLDALARQPRQSRQRRRSRRLRCAGPAFRPGRRVPLPLWSGVPLSRSAARRLGVAARLFVRTEP